MKHAESLRLLNDKIIRCEERMVAWFGSHEFQPEWFSEKLKWEKLRSLKDAVNVLQGVLRELDDMGCDCCFEKISALCTGVEDEQELLLLKGVAL